MLQAVQGPGQPIVSAPLVFHRLYTPGPFYAAKLTTTLPLNILIALFFTWTGYGMFGYRHSALALVQVRSCVCAVHAQTHS